MALFCKKRGLAMKESISRMTGNLCLFAFAAAITAACSEHDAVAEAIYRDFQHSGKKSVNLGTAVPQPWQRVCIIGPYTDNAATHAALGFKWDSDKVSNVATDDTVVLLAFVDHADKVAFFTNYPRGQGDFSNLSRQCFDRSHARFEHLATPQRGWPGLFASAANHDAAR